MRTYNTYLYRKKNLSRRLYLFKSLLDKRIVNGSSQKEKMI